MANPQIAAILLAVSTIIGAATAADAAGSLHGNGRDGSPNSPGGTSKASGGGGAFLSWSRKDGWGGSSQTSADGNGGRAPSGSQNGGTSTGPGGTRGGGV